MREIVLPARKNPEGRVRRGRASVLREATCTAKLAPVELVDVGLTGKRPVPRGPYVSATYASIRASCPRSCTFYGEGGGCFAESGFTGMLVRKLDAGADEHRMGVDGVALEEADLIDGAFRGGSVPGDGARGGRDLRLHISGDATTRAAALILGAAASRWHRRGGGAVWTYTHAWRTVPRAAWGPDVSALASVERPEDAESAADQGYAPAIVVEQHASDKAHRLRGSSLRWVPCPWETRRQTCAECRLCLDDRKLRRSGLGIAFAVHGVASGEAKRRLRVLREAA